QERLRDQTRTLAQRMVARRVTADTAFQRIAEILPRAAEEMDRAAARLRERDAAGALPPEQRALQQLQRAEAIFREVQVSMGQQGGAGGGATPNAEDLADLFELELDKLQDQYETVNRAAPGRDSTDAAVDETAERLEELARRQQQEIERQRREAARGRGTAGGAEQRQLADQVEEEARRLERLSRDRRQPELRDAARRLRDAAESMRRGAAGSRQGERAVEELREARRLLERSRDQDLRRRARQAAETADRLAGDQERVRREAADLRAAGPGPERAERERRLQVRKQNQRAAVDSLERELRGLAAETGASGQQETARRLRDAAGSISETRVGEKIDFSRQLVGGGAPDEYVRELEEQIQEDLDEVDERLEGIEDTFEDRAEGERAERAIEQAGDLARGLESMRRRGEEARERASGNPRGPGGFNPDAARQGRGEARQRLEDARELRNQLRDQGVGTDEIDAVMRGLERLTDESVYGDMQELIRLQTALADRAKRLELVLRVRLTGEERLRLFLSGDPSVDPEYRALVEEYFRSLSRENGGR
ncbi:MAG: hypothetical protein GWM90_19970, partial [Gemmatimonadetes bacterium]|nr:hypothetical protein [Gemmatimonadota bacterium]NIQ56718.1 hypothetical protein [Gemmatimonadota bacterium]NIU76904.1 hypothetical protein [Gammaproteobacteria bacterium]NIX46279.1 hypothetical protein [Gemmatimonadota bacterium]NIY10600.1 hypothetical protein [Gemmatimonadota bacterium]